MSQKTLLSLAVVTFLAIAGGLILNQVYNSELLEHSKTSTPTNSETEPNEDTNDRTADFDDELGLMDLSRGLLTDLMQIINDEGTGLDVIDLADQTEVQLNETIKDVDLNEDQMTMVENLTGTLDKIRELAQSGSSPAQIAEEIRPNKRTN